MIHFLSREKGSHRMGGGLSSHHRLKEEAVRSDLAEAEIGYSIFDGSDEEPNPSHTDDWLGWGHHLRIRGRGGRHSTDETGLSRRFQAGSRNGIYFSPLSATIEVGLYTHVAGR